MSKIISHSNILDKFSEGDLITTYHKGYFKIVKIERRFYTEHDINYYYKNDPNKKVGDEYSPLFHYTQEYDAEGFPKKGRAIKKCDAFYCEIANLSITKDITEMYSKIERLREIQIKYV